MKVLKFKNQPVYEETLPNGLKVILIPRMEHKNIYMTYNVRVGGRNLNIKVDEKIINFKSGTAHFLEHLLFEAPGEISLMNQFKELGFTLNGNTNSFRTRYYFYGLSDYGDYDKAVKLLINMVNEPYFSEDQIAKESKIIASEHRRMLANNERMIVQAAIRNIYFDKAKHLNVLGNIQDIKKMDLENIANFYKYFYQPNNTHIVISGKFDYKKIMTIIKKEFEKTKPSLPFEVIEFNEPNEVVKPFGFKYFPISLRKIGYSFKIKLSQYTIKEDVYLSMYLGLLFDKASDIYQKNMQKHWFDDFDYGIKVNFENKVVIAFDFVIKDIKLGIKLIDETMKQPIKEEDFNRLKKVYLSNITLINDSTYSLNDRLADYITEYNEIFDPLPIYENLDYYEFQKFVKSLDFSNKSIFIARPKKEKENEK